MSSWGGMTLTNKGMILQGKAQAGAQLIYTRIAVGDGTLSGQSVPALNGLISQKKNLPITRLRTQPPNKVMIGTTLSNADVTTGFYFREVGLFATDPDAGEILYAYANSGSTADYIAPAGDGVIEKTFDTVVVIGTTSNVSAIIDDSLVFTRESEFNAKFDASGGHKHTGAAGDGPKLTAASLAAGAATDTVIGDRTADPATATAYGLKGPITQWFSWIAKYFKAITGKANPFDTPDITLAATKVHVDSTIVHVTAAERTAWNGKVDKVTGKQLSTEDYTTLEKTKLAGIATGANNYTHPTGDGNQHVPATGTSNNGKVLKAGATAGSSSWGNVNGSEVVEDATHRFATDAEKATWNAKETTTGSQAKADAAVLPINTRLNTESLTPINLVAGQQILNATKNARLQGLKVQGRTLIDLLGGAGSGESLTGWALSGTTLPETSTAQKKSGTSSIKCATTSGTSVYVQDFAYVLDVAKQYILGCWVYVESYTSGGAVLSLRDKGSATVRYSVQVDAAKVGQWQFVYIKIPTANTLSTSGFRLQNGVNTVGTMVVYFDELRLYAVSAADYAAIGTTINNEAIDRLLPYVPPGINGVDGLWVRRYGKNLLAGDVSILTGSTVKVVGPYSFDLTTTVTNGNAYIIADVLTNTNYTFSSVLETNALLAVFDETGTSSLTGYGATARTFNSGANTKVRLYFRNDGAASTKRYSNWQLELGSTATPFQPREDSLIAFGGVELHATIANSDSGWGDSYTPSADEIKAYFNGYQMGSVSGATFTTPYISGTKAWRFVMGDTSTGTSTLPTDQNYGHVGWKPYQLLYRLATPVTETVQEDGSLSLLEGDNFIEVGSGYVSRERITPYLWNSYYESNISIVGMESAKLKYKVFSIMSVYESSRLFQKWRRITFGLADTLYGERFNIAQADYDSSQPYSVSYIKLDKSPVPSVAGFYAASEKAQLHDLTDAVTEISSTVSALAAKKAEKDTPAWLYPTLLNGWVQFTSIISSASFYKDSFGIVHVRGTISSGVSAADTQLFMLPVGYRPAIQTVVTASSSNGTAMSTGIMDITTSGRVSLGASGGVFYNGLLVLDFSFSTV
ncbi:hypothetical protein BJP48_18865 [Paenibacillus odorifer]|nr:hypothetical protein BJP48_18865 [Paenibacillus odorifer]